MDGSGDKISVLNHVKTEEDSRDRAMWGNLVLGEERLRYSGQRLGEEVKLCTLYTQCSSACRPRWG